MPITKKAIKVASMGAGWYPPDHPKHVPGLAFNGHAARNLKAGGSWFNVADGIKQHGSGREWFAGDGKSLHLPSSKSPARKAASAHIAKIPLKLAQWIAHAWRPQ